MTITYKVLFLLTIIGLTSFNAEAQRGARVGYIDTEYILQNLPEYQEASTQLNKKVLQWKADIEKQLNEIKQKKTELENERVLLTKELYEERYEDISFDEAEILDYQQKRFGPEGDLITQKRQLVEPIQDQIFAAVREIAERKKFDFIFDKSADIVMLYSAERYDVSEQVLKTITRTSKRTQAKSKKDIKALEEEAVVPVVSGKGDKDERQQALEDRKAAREAQLAARRAEREKAIEDRRKEQEALRAAKKQEAEERRQAVLDARKAKNAPETKENAEKENLTEKNSVKKDTVEVTKKSIKQDSIELKPAVKKDSIPVKNKIKTAAEILEERRLQKLKEREARQKALEDRKKKIIEQRKKAREAREKKIKKNDSIAKAKKDENNN